MTLVILMTLMTSMALVILNEWKRWCQFGVMSFCGLGDFFRAGCGNSINLYLQISFSSSRYRTLPPDIWFFLQISTSTSRYLALHPDIELFLQISGSSSKYRALPPDIKQYPDVKLYLQKSSSSSRYLTLPYVVDEGGCGHLKFRCPHPLSYI